MKNKIILKIHAVFLNFLTDKENHTNNILNVIK